MMDIARVLLLICLSFVAIPALASPEAIVTPLIAKDLPELQGKEGEMILVEYPPGGSQRTDHRDGLRADEWHQAEQARVLPRTNVDGSHRHQGFAQSKWAQWRNEGVIPPLSRRFSRR